MKLRLVTQISASLLLLSASAFGLDDDRWNGLLQKPSVLALQREGIDQRVADAHVTWTTASISSLAAGTGVRVRALVTAPTTGAYTFRIAGSNAATLWLSSDDSRFGKQPIAWLYEATNAQEWAKFTTQSSAAINLVEGASYYLEAQVMCSAANGHLELGWDTPGQTTTQLIPLAQLAPLPADAADANDNNLPDAFEVQTGLDISELPGALAQTGDPDADGITNWDEYLLGSNPLVKEHRADGLTRDIWAGSGGTNISMLTSFNRTRFFSYPSEITQVPNMDDPALSKNAGVRYRGFLVAPVTGEYRLWIAGNEQCELWFADGTVKDPTTNAPLTNRFGKQRLAHNKSPNDSYPSAYQGYDRLAVQRTRVVHLTQGQSYYIEALHVKGNGTPSHISVAWQVPGQARSVIPASALLSDVPDDGDKDADFLPDDWETSKTLSITDNGLTNSKEGQYGDFDSDGLTNLDEFQYGTDPKSADTDGDGLTDHNEIFYYGTNPLVSNTLNPLLAAQPNVQQYSSNTGGWSANADGTLSAWDARGAITYTFTLSEPGVHEVILTGAAIGIVRSVERLPIVLSVDGGSPFCNQELVSNNGGQGSVKEVTPWLSAGTHTLTILHDNYLTARRLRIDSIEIHRLGGQDLDEDGIPDWVEQNAVAQNALTRVPTQSRTSPASIEGITQNLATTVLQYTPYGQSQPTALSASASINNSFFADVPLSEGGTTTLDASFLGGLTGSLTGIDWIATNLFEFDGATLNIRANDALRLDAWSGASADGQTFTVTSNGTLLADANQNTTHSSGQPFAATFATAGTYTLVASHGGQEATVTLQVHSANFGPALSVRSYSARTWTPTLLDSTAQVQYDEVLTCVETTGQTGPRIFSVNLQQPKTCHVIARLPEDADGAPSAILARGTVNGFYIGYLSDTKDAQIITQYADGTYLMSGTLIVANLPADVLIKLRTEHQGTIFTNGSNILWLTAADFDANGVVSIYYEWSGTGDPKLCNHLQVFVEIP